MAKRIDPLKAKQAKQKKIAIVLGVLLLAVVAFQGPKTLKMLKGPQPLPTATTSTPAATPPVTPTGTAAPTDGLPAPAQATQPAVLADSDLPPLATESQLLSFEQFQTKDPFAQQVDIGQGAGGSASGSTEEGAASAQSSPGASASGPKADSAGSGSQDKEPNVDPPTFSVPGPGDDGADAPAQAPVTRISVNGVVESVETKASFPADEPVFQLVSLARDGKSVRIGVAGGSYATGEPTIALVLGKTLTLQNTADGSRYVLKLLAVEGFVPPKRSN